MSSEASPNTRELILDTAEKLFADHGIQAVSVRRILAEAGVNTALAHYHFGDRDGLIREVLRRRIEPLNRERMELLDRAVEEAAPEFPSLDAVLRAFFSPVVSLLSQNRPFARLVGEVHVSASPEVRDFSLRLFSEVVRRFAEFIRPALPAELSGTERLARAHFVTGVMVLTLTNYEDMDLMSQGRYELPREERLVNEMVTFCVAGLTAQAPRDEDVAGEGSGHA